MDVHNGRLPVKQEYAYYICEDCGHRVKVSIQADGSVHPPYDSAGKQCTVEHDTVGRTHHNWFRPHIIMKSKYHEASQSI